MIPILCWAPLAAAEAPSARDFEHLRSVEAPLVSPDGRHLVVSSSRSTFDADADAEPDEAWSRDTQLWLVPTSGAAPRPLTRGEAAPSGAVFAADGSGLAFLRDHDGDAAIWWLPLAGGEARRIPLEDYVPRQVAVAADGGHLLVRATPEAPDAPHRFLQPAPNARLLRVPLDGGAPAVLTDGGVHVSSFTAASVEGGDRVAVVTSATPDRYEEWLVPSLQLLGDDGALTPVAEGPCIGDVAFSPGGDHLAWIGCATGLLSDALLVHDLASGTSADVLEGQDLTVSGFAWQPDGRRLVVAIQDRTRTGLGVVGRTGGALRRLPLDETELSGLALGPRGRTLYTRTSSPDHARQIRAIRLGRRRSEVLWDPNPHVADWALSAPRVVRWTAPDDYGLEGVYWPAVGERRALVVMPHGGPDGVSDLGFSSWAQFFATHGIAVFQPNYRGGIGYGGAHYAANRGRLGEIELGDIESGVDQLLADGLAEEARLLYGGWSWGGYLTAWTIGHTARYRAAVAGAPVVDTVAQYVGSDINHALVADWEYRARPWGTGRAAFEKADPSRHLHKVTTPTLVLHGDRDRRVPFDQGLTLYRALSDREVETELWVYPGEGHGLQEPAHRVHRLEVWLGWYDRHLP